MKFPIIVFAIFTAVLFVGCQETKEDIKKPVSEKDIYKTIGEEIPFETGMEWIALHKKRSGLGRTESSGTFSISSEQMNASLQSIADLTGVAFHYATDEAGTTHILAIPVDGSLEVWSNDNKIIIDANTGNQISKTTALSWSQTFKALNPDGIWFHFFGKNIFDEMRALPYFDSVSIEPATSTLDLSPQLLLVILNQDMISIGRTQATEGTVYDASNACPPCATK